MKREKHLQMLPHQNILTLRRTDYPQKKEASIFLHMEVRAVLIRHIKPRIHFVTDSPKSEKIWGKKEEQFKSNFKNKIAIAAAKTPLAIYSSCLLLCSSPPAYSLPNLKQQYRSYVRCHHWRNLGEGYKNSLYYFCNFL